MRQIAALPYLVEDDGSVRILLITSRETRRWVIPKGNRIPGLLPHDAAAREAFEEAGISGDASALPIGAFSYDKRRGDGTIRRTTVDVFPLLVTGHYQTWPEQGQRDQAWFTTTDAAAAVEEPELKAILAGFRKPAAVEKRPAASGWLARLFGI